MKLLLAGPLRRLAVSVCFGTGELRRNWRRGGGSAGGGSGVADHGDEGFASLGGGVDFVREVDAGGFWAFGGEEAEGEA